MDEQKTQPFDSKLLYSKEQLNEEYESINIMLNARNYAETTNTKLNLNFNGLPSELTYTDKKGNTIKSVKGVPRVLTYMYEGREIRLIQPRSIYRKLSGMEGLNYSD